MGVKHYMGYILSVVWLEIIWVKVYLLYGLQI
jgi:hypothetical protein